LVNNDELRVIRQDAVELTNSRPNFRYKLPQILTNTKTKERTT